MANILVLKNFKITDHTQWYSDRTSETALSENYDAMEQLCVKSAHKNLRDLDEVIVHRGTADNIRDVFRQHFHMIWDLWLHGHNILYSDLDVLFVRPVEYFGKFDRFTMFNYTEPMSTYDEFYNISFNHYFNCGIRYYPSGMAHETWQIGKEMIENWNPDRWDAEQIIYNQMMWSQAIALSDVLRPELAFQYLRSPTANNQFNGISLSDALAIHFHGSRGSANRLSLMQQFT